MALILRKVLISDNMSPRCAEVFKRNGIEVDVKTKLTKEQLLTEIPNYDGLIVRSATKVTADVIAAASNLKIIGRAGTGVDNIDIPAASQRGIIVMNTPGGNTMSAVEHTCALISALARHIPQAHHAMREGRWDRKVYMGTELMGKTLAIIGLGRIGREVAQRMQSYGMTTIGFDPLVSAEEAAKFSVEWLQLDDIWPRADYITVHTPLIPQTRGLIGEKSFPVCKKGVKVINVARGGIIDEEWLLKALESGQCGGAALDVFTEEPPTNTALVQHPKIICTPHLGASTEEAQVRVAVEIAEQFVAAAKGESLFGALNARALMNALRPETGPIVALGKSLGTLAARLAGDSITQVTVTSSGPNLKEAGSYLGVAVTAGLLAGRISQPINLVNAAAFAKEMGIEVNVSYEESARNCVKVSSGSLNVLGEVQGSCPVLLEINNQSFGAGATLAGNLLFFQAPDPVKHLGEISNVLAGSSNEILGFSTAVPNGGERWSVVKFLASPSNLAAFEKTVPSYVISF